MVELRGLGRPELRRLARARRDVHAARRRQRLRRQGPLRRRLRGPPARGHGRALRRRGERDRRQHRAVRRDRRAGLLPRPRGRALRGAQLGRVGGRRGRRRPRLRVHDRRARRRARADRAQLRGRHERRRGLRARRGRRRSRERCNMGMVGFEELAEADAIELRAMVDEHQQRTDSPVAARVLAEWEALLDRRRVREGDAARLQARAARTGARRRSRAGGAPPERAELPPARLDRWTRRPTARLGRQRRAPDGQARRLSADRAPRGPPAGPARARARLPRVPAHAPGRRAARAGRPLHGLRRSLLPQRLSAGQPDPGLERPRLPRPLRRRDRPAARDEQLPRVHRPAVPGAVRGGVRARDPRGRRGDDQTDRERDHQPCLGGGLGRRRSRRGARPASRWRSSARAPPAWPPPSSCAAPATA